MDTENMLPKIDVDLKLMWVDNDVEGDNDALANRLEKLEGQEFTVTLKRKHS